MASVVAELGSRRLRRSAFRRRRRPVRTPAVALAAAGAEAQRPSLGGRLPSEVRDLVAKQIRGEIPELEIRGAPTGWSCLDKFYRVAPAELTVVTGCPGSGKTEFLLSLLVNLAQTQKWRCCVCAFEARLGGYEQVIQKRLGKNLMGLQTAEGQSLVTKAHEWVTEHFQFISDTMEMRPEQLLERIRCCVYRNKCQVVMIDPYNYIDWRSDADQSETQFVSSFLTSLKQFCQETKCHVLLVAHPSKSRKWRDEAPGLYDIAGSAHFYNKCDMGLALKRNRDPAKGSIYELNITVAKVRNRDAGNLGVTRLWYEKRTSSYSEEPTWLTEQAGADGQHRLRTPASRAATPRETPKKGAAQNDGFSELIDGYVALAEKHVGA